MLVDYVRNKIEEIEQLKSNLRKELETVVRDTSIDLNERWNAFISSGLGKHDKWIQHFESLKPKFNNSQQSVDDYLIGDSYDRHQTITVDDLYMRLGYTLDDHNGKAKYTAWTENARYEKLETVLDQTDLDNFREECLSRFLYSFDYDW